MPSKKTKTESAPVNQWGQSTKLVVGITLVAIAAALVVRFNNILGPLILASVLSYLLYPFVAWVSKSTRLSWRGAVGLIFLVFLALIIFLFTVLGVAVVQELQNVVRVVQNFVQDLPALAEDLLNNNTLYTIPIINTQFRISDILANLNIDLLNASQQIISAVQPVLGQAGSLVGALAGGAISTIGWGIFILLFSYFFLADAGQGANLLPSIDLPHQMDELRRLGRETGRLWNAFLRGQFVLIIIVGLIYIVLLNIIGLRNALAVAVLAAIARFLPYIGPLITNAVVGAIAFLQPSNYFGMTPFNYALLAVIIVVVVDQVVDNLVAPRVFSSALGIHPAVLLIAVIIASNLLGFVGLILAAPVLATVQLTLRYTSRKMLDLDPWPESEKEPEPLLKALRRWLNARLAALKTRNKKGSQ